MTRDRPHRTEAVHWLDVEDRLFDLASECELRHDGDRGLFFGGPQETPEIVFRPSILQPLAEGVVTVGAYLDSLSAGPGTWALLLLQAGAASLGYWDDDELLSHKVFKRYVVRGTGRAQTTHLKTKGKSRYGSRLRLQNAKRLLEEVNERLTGWWEDMGPPDRILASCPVRMWPELWSVKPPPPFERDAVDRGIPIDVAVPSFEELQRVGRFLLRARIEWYDEAT